MRVNIIIIIIIMMIIIIIISLTTWDRIDPSIPSSSYSGVARVSSAGGPMLGAAPPRLVNPASAPGGKNRQAKKKKGLQHEKVETQGDRGP